MGVSSGRESFYHTEYGIRFMLAPRLAKAKHSTIPGNTHGIRNFPGYPSFSGSFFKRTAEQFSFNGVLAISKSFSLLLNIFLIVDANLGIKMIASAKLMSKCKS